jgi:hypothetical protein
MNQNDLSREVARMTGETVQRIQRMGFGLIIVPTRPIRPIPKGKAQVIPAAAAVEADNTADLSPCRLT